VTRFAITSVYRLPDGAELIIMTEPSPPRTEMFLDDELVEREVSAREGYALWAGHYDQEVNALIAIETPYVEAILNELPVATALDAATGTGRHALRLARRGVRVTAIDQSPEMLAVARAHAAREGLPITFHEGDLGDMLPFPDASFDLVLSALALCHIPQLAEAVREFARVTWPGGSVVVTDWHPLGEGYPILSGGACDKALGFAIAASRRCRRRRSR
jgi:SAM-dependent methyltransferase